jgi:hypothetical protein
VGEIEKMMTSEVGDEVIEVVVKNLEKIKEESNTSLLAKNILYILNNDINKFKAQHGSRLQVTRNTREKTSERTMEATNTLAADSIVCRASKNPDKTVTISAEHVTSALINSGFLRACSDLQKMILSGDEIPHEKIINPLMMLADYFGSM